MKWCPTCKIEFEEYVEKCSDCGEMLLSEIEFNMENNHKHYEYNPDVLRLSVVYESTLESDVLHVSALLEENGIYSEIKNNGIGSYLQIYSGVNYLGTSICVKEEDAEAAKSIIENLWGETTSEMQIDVVEDNQVEPDDSDMATYRLQYNNKLKFRRNILKVFLFLMLGTSLIVMLMSIVN